MTHKVDTGGDAGEGRLVLDTEGDGRTDKCTHYLWSASVSPPP